MSGLPSGEMAAAGALMTPATGLEDGKKEREIGYNPFAFMEDEWVAVRGRWQQQGANDAGRRHEDRTREKLEEMRWPVTEVMVTPGALKV
eukprot:1162062-Pelagomonas_calceolata.AAC.11